MRKMVVLGMGAAALLATVAFAQDEDSSRLAAADKSATFTKLDTDADGRVSAIEAAGDSKVAQGFTAADADKDGYLSKAEFAQLGRSMDRAAPDDRTAPPTAPRSESSPSQDDYSTPPK
jgi:EF hand domain-containing protein